MSDNEFSITPKCFISVGEVVEYNGSRAIVQGAEIEDGRLWVFLNTGEKEPVRVWHKAVKKIATETNIVHPGLQ